MLLVPGKYQAMHTVTVVNECAAQCAGSKDVDMLLQGLGTCAALQLCC